jgi:predicted amidohydrolase YtcJ
MLYGLYCAVERKGFDDGPELRFYPRERVLIDDAVYAYTMGGARACGMESEVGSIEQGKYADFVHLSHDPMRSDTERLQQTEVIDVFVGGEAVYQPEKEQ